ncbi:MAG: T9SS type A sorting domain-containing protein [Bacteroidetes bacterium]|nr:T9SS type A sorting domain-containing protein [Bacteroidota bacterium]
MKKAILTISLVLSLNIILFSQVTVANFTCTVDSAAPPYCRYHFWDLSTNNPQIWLWNFGDGGVSSLQNPVHHFFYGNFLVILIAINSFGSDTTMCHVLSDSTGCYCCSTSTEIESIKLQKNSITVYPNPSTTELHIKVRGKIVGVYTIAIYDTQGKTVDIITTLEQETVIDISKYQQGIYWVRVLGNNIVKSEKIIKLMTK